MNNSVFCSDTPVFRLELFIVKRKNKKLESKEVPPGGFDFQGLAICSVDLDIAVDGNGENA